MSMKAISQMYYEHGKKTIQLFECQVCGALLGMDQDTLDRVSNVKGHCFRCAGFFRFGGVTEYERWLGDHVCPEECVHQIGNGYVNCRMEMLTREQLSAMNLCVSEGHVMNYVDLPIGRSSRCLRCGCWKHEGKAFDLARVGDIDGLF